MVVSFGFDVPLFWFPHCKFTKSKLLSKARTLFHRLTNTHTRTPVPWKLVESPSKIQYIIGYKRFDWGEKNVFILSNLVRLKVVPIDQHWKRSHCSMRVRDSSKKVYVVYWKFQMLLFHRTVLYCICIGWHKSHLKFTHSIICTAIRMVKTYTFHHNNYFSWVINRVRRAHKRTNQREWDDSDQLK